MTKLKPNGNNLSILLSTCADLFDHNERFSLSDRVIAKAISSFVGNRELEVVLPKVILISQLYYTPIFKPEEMAKHILYIDIDRQLACGDQTLIDEIRQGHKIRTNKYNKEIDFYSFASKYAAHHEPKKFVMFDSLVMRLLSTLNKRHQFCKHFTQVSLRDYKRYTSVIDALISFTGLETFKYKRFDQGLWIYAKYLYTAVNLLDKEVDAISIAEREYAWKE